MGIEKRHLAFPLFRYNLYSQNGEDGIIEFILKKISLIPPFIIDIGANDGLVGSNSRMLIERYKYGALLIEPYLPAFEQLQKLYQNNTTVQLRNVAVGTSTQKEGFINWHGHFKQLPVALTDVNTVLKQAQIPDDIGFLSIDIDGQDNDVLQSINWRLFSPWIVIAEINSSSFKYLQEQINLMDQAGYTPILHIGNVFYVKKEMAGLYFFNWKIELEGQYGFFFRHH